MAEDLVLGVALLKTGSTFKRSTMELGGGCQVVSCGFFGTTRKGL